MGCERVSPQEAVARWVPRGGCVAVGGMHSTSAPMSLVREMVRQGVRVGRLVTSPSASLQADLLIGAGLVDEVMSPYLGFEDLGLAPCFRREVESGRLRVAECDEGSLTHALYAGAGGLPFIPCPPGIDLTDIPSANSGFYRRTTDPFTGQEVWVVSPLRPDVALIHAGEADDTGTVALGGFPFTDRLMALAARRLVVQVERLVSPREMAGRSPGSTLPGFLVTAVVVAPGGCHPTAAPGYYHRDEEELRAYLQAARQPKGFEEYVERTIRTVNEADYLARARARLGLAPGGGEPR